MTVKIPVTREGETVLEVRSSLLQGVQDLETIDYVYVVDDAGKFVGVMSIRELYRAASHASIGQVCRRTNLHSVRTTTDQERAAYLAFRNDLKAMPVTDRQHVLVGVIPSRTIHNIIYSELHEDLLHLVGVRHPKAALHTSTADIPLLESFLHRSPWLFIGLLGGMFSAHIIGSFETTLSQNLVLASFIPLVVYMSDAIGTQMEAFIIRDLAVDHVQSFRHYFVRQLLVVLLLATYFSLLLYFFALGFYSDRAMSTVLGISLFTAIGSSVFTGLLVPYAFSKCRLDPAEASGPIATIIQDILSVSLYFSIASWFL